MSRGKTCLAALPILVLAGAVAYSAPVKVAPGQEFVYTGTLEWKQSGAGVPTLTQRAPVKLLVLVAAVDPTQGYTIIQMRDIRPERRPGKDDLPPFAEVFTERYHPDLSQAPSPPRPPRAVFGDPLAPLLWNRPIPFHRVFVSSRTDLRIGQSWRTMDHISMPGVRSPWVNYTVASDTKVAGRNCARIEIAALDLPSKNPMGDSSVDVTDYGGTLCIDQDTGVVASDDRHQSVRYTTGEKQIRTDVRAVVTLKGIRQLSANELASRIKQAEVIYQVEQTAFGEAPGTDRKKQVEATQQAIAQLRRDYPASVYAPALTPIETYLQPEARRLALQDAPAPDFRIKDLTGKEQTLAAYRGKLILLNFFASW